MLVDIGSPDKYVKANDLKEILSGNLFGRASSVPDETGLVSYEIFGLPGTKSRKMNFAYIDLGDYFIHPMVLEDLIRLKKIMKDVVYGNGNFYIKGGNIFKIGQNPEVARGLDVGSGIRWLKKHFREINFSKEGMSATVRDRVTFINSMQDDEIFITKWMVIPAYYRDVDLNTNKKNDINMMYQTLLSQAHTIKQMNTMFSSGEMTDSHRKIQDKINEIYTYFLTFIGGTKAFFQKHAIGKAPDFSARMVISTAQITSQKPEEMSTDYTHSACPLSMVLECFEPFIEYGFEQFIRRQISGSDFIYTKDKMGNVTRVQLAPHWEQCLLHDNIHQLIRLYTDSKEHRLDYFTVEAADGSMIPLGYVVPENEENFKITSTDTMIGSAIRPITLCEMFYMIAKEMCNDKYVMITRFPIEDYQAIYPSQMNIMPYEKTKICTIEGVVYDRFPDITEEDIANKENENIGAKFNDTLHLFPTYLKALGADFDGDTVTVQGVFSKNKLSNYVNSPMNFINIAGSTMREVTDAMSQVLFGMTRTVNDV